MEFKIGDQVIHCRDGLAVIFSTSEISGNEYFLVKATKPNSETIYVPKKTAESIIRPLLSKTEADEVLSNVKFLKKEFNTNTKQRRDAYKKKLLSGNVNDIAYLYRLYYLLKMEPEGVKLGPSDIDMLSSASNMLLDELAIVFSIDREIADDFVIERINSL